MLNKVFVKYLAAYTLDVEVGVMLEAALVGEVDECTQSSLEACSMPDTGGDQHASMSPYHHTTVPSYHGATVPSCHHRAMPPCHHAAMPPCQPKF